MLKEEKRGLYTSAQRRMVTGLLLTPDGKVSLGRHRKRAILSLINSYQHGLLAPANVAQLQGLVAFARDAEPSFYETLLRKYGAPVISNLSRYRLVERIAPDNPIDVNS